MGRKQDPLYFDKKWGVFYARWYEDGKRIRFSLGTGDRIEATGGFQSFNPLKWHGWIMRNRSEA